MTDLPTQGDSKEGNRGSLDGALREIMTKFLQGVDDMLPGVVIEYDRTENRAKVQPLIKIMLTDGTVLDRPEIASIPVLNIGGGNAVLSFNIKPGDLGWIKASDRDISLFMQSMVSSAPNTLRKHSFSDALFIPDAFRKWTLNVEDENSTVLQTLDGSQRIVLDDNLIRLESDNQIHLTAASAIVVDAPSTFWIGNFLLSGTFGSGGSIGSNEDITGDADGAAVSLVNHDHDPGTYAAGGDPVTGTSDPPN